MSSSLSASLRRPAGLWILVALGGADSLPAQGFGHLKLEVDAQAATPHAGNGSQVDDALLGVQFLAGEYYVTGRDAANLSGNHSIYVFDAAGAVARVFDQPAYTQTSLWGFRDGMTDGVGLGFGFEGGIGFVDGNGAPLASFDGIALAANPLVFASFAGTVYRALDYDPVAKTVFVGDFGAQIQEFDLATGALLHSWVNPAGADEWSAYGLALDPRRTSAGEAFLWISGDANTGDIRGYRLPRGGPSQPAIATTARIERADPLAEIGGLSGVPGGTPGWSPTSHWDLVALGQGTTDRIATYRVELKASCDGLLAPRLVGGNGRTPGLAAANASDEAIVRFYPGDFVHWNFADPEPGNPKFGTVWGNMRAIPFLDETDDRNSTLFDPTFEFRVAWAASTPAGFLPLYLAPNFTVDPFGITFPIPVGVFEPDDGFRLQGLVLDPCLGNGFPVYATNQVRFLAEKGFRPPVRVVAQGVDNFNDDTTRGFWRIENRDPSGRTIVSVKLDWAASTDPRQATMRFDTDQIGMADLFEGGNGALPGCQGTYRNGSNLIVGLVHDPLCTVPTTPCDPAANTGWIGSNPGTILEDWRTLEFRFADFQPGEVFEFDCDTDGGLGRSGADMIGLVVTATLSDASVHSAVLVRTGYRESSASM